MADEKKDKYIVGSYFYNEESPWGWKYGFTLSKEISVEQLRALLRIIEESLNKEDKIK